MSNLIQTGKRALTVIVASTMVMWSMGVAALAPVGAATLANGDLIKASGPAVYYYMDGKRLPFPNDKVFKSWFADFSKVKTITDAELSAISLAGTNMSYRPGTRLVKITTDPKTYAVEPGGVLRWITSEAVAKDLYGDMWNKQIDDVADVFFTNYSKGADVSTASPTVGSLVKTADSSDIYYVGSLGKRKVDGFAAFSANGFQSQFVRTPSNAIVNALTVGQPITGAESALTTPVASTTPAPTPTTGGGTLNVALGANNPVSATLISDGATNVAGSQALAPMLSVLLTNGGANDIKVSGLKFTRGGISADSDIDSAYLFDGSTRLAEMSSLSGAVLTFLGLNVVVPKGSSKTLMLKVDLNRDMTSGKTLSFSLLAKTDVTSDATDVAVSALTGNAMSVATVSDFGRLTAALVATAAAADPGTNGFEAFRFTLAASNQKVKLWSINMTKLGSIANADVANFKLYDGSTQVGSTVAALNADGTLTFALATPLEIDSGVTKTMRVLVDLTGGASRTFQLSLQRAVDLVATDANYMVNLKADTALGTFATVNSTQVTMNSGNLTVTLRTDSPSGNVTLNGTNVDLARYDLKAVGENVKVDSVTIAVTSTGGAQWTNLRNVKLIFDGAQVGTTQASVADNNTATAITVNFTVPAGTTKTLIIRSDVAAASGAANAVADTETVRARINAAGISAQRMTVLSTFTTPAAAMAGSNLTVSASALTAAANVAQAAITTVGGTNNALVGSWILTAGSTEGIDVNSITVTKDDASTFPAAFSSMRLYNGATQLGTTIGNPTDAAQTFSLSPSLSIAAGQSVQIDLKADVLTSPTWTTGHNAFINASGTSKVTGGSVTSAAADLDGQGVTIAAAGTLSLDVDPSSPATLQHAMGAFGVNLGVWKFSADTVEDLTVSQIIVANTNAGGSPNVRNLKLYDGATQVGTTIPSFVANSATFNVNAGMFTIAKGTNKVITLKADVTPFSDVVGTAGNQVVGSITPPAIIIGVTTDAVIARGASGNYALVLAADQAVASAASAQYPYRTTLSPAWTAQGATSGRTRSSSDTVARLSLTGTANADVQLRSALQANDEAVATWTETDAGAVIATAVNAVNKVDGTNSIAATITNNGAGVELADAISGIQVNMAQDVDATNFSRVSFWLRTSIATTAAGDVTFYVNDAANTTTMVDEANTGVIAANTWTYITGTLATTAGANNFFGLRFNRAEWGGAPVISLDNIRFYNDSAVVNLSGNFTATGNNDPLSVILRDTSGVTRAQGYVVATTTAGTLTLLGGADIGDAAAAAPSAGLLASGATSLLLDAVANTNTLMATDTTAAESLGMTINLGTPTSAGDLRWWDQAVTATSPITWVNPGPAGLATPLSVSLAY